MPQGTAPPASKHPKREDATLPPADNLAESLRIPRQRALNDLLVARHRLHSLVPFAGASRLPRSPPAAHTLLNALMDLDADQRLSVCKIIAQLSL